MNMRSALVYSCDTYFYNLALRVGIDTIVKYAEMTGLWSDYRHRPCG